MRIAPGLLMAGLVAGMLSWPARADAAKNAEQLASFRAVAFGKVTSASVAKIIDLKKHAQDGAPNRREFHGFAVISTWLNLRPKSSQGLAALLRSPIDQWVQAYSAAGDGDLLKLSTFCVPDPGYAVHLETDRGPRDFTICLQCDSVAAYGKGGTSAEFALDEGPLNELKKYYREEFSE